MDLENVFILYNDEGSLVGVYDSEDKAQRAKQAWIECVVDCPFNDQAQRDIEHYNRALAIEEVQVE
jgi:hypothetical protein